MTARRFRLSDTAGQVVAVTFVILIAQAVGGIILARGLGPADRGLLAALVLWSTVAADLSAVGTPYAVSYWAASGSPRAGLRILAKALPLMSVVGLAIFGAIVWFSGRREELPFLAVVVMALWIPGQLVNLPLQRLQQGIQRMRNFDRMRLVSEAGPAFGYAAFALLGVLTVAAGAASITGFVIVAAAIGFVLARRTVPAVDDEQDEGTRAFWSYASRSWLSVLATRSNATIDLLVLTLLAVSATDVGFYAVAGTSAGVIAVLVGSLGLDLFPRIAALPEGADGRPMLTRYIGASAVLAAVGAVVFALLASWLIPLVYGDDFEGAVGAARILAFGLAASAISRVAGQGLAAMGFPGQLAVAQIVGAVVTLVGVAIAAGVSLEWVAVAGTAGYVVTMLGVLGFTWIAARRLYL